MTNARRACAGETLVETLVAVLVSSMAMLMLATAVMVSVKIISNGKQAMENYTKEERELAKVESGTSDKVTITVAHGGHSNTDIVNIKYVSKTNLPGLQHGTAVVSYKPV